MWADTHCKHGHEWTDSNTYLYLDGKGRPRRKCRACTLRRLGETRTNLGRIRKVLKVDEGGDSRRDDSYECIRVNRLTALQEQLERETRPWLRPELEAQIKELKNA